MTVIVTKKDGTVVVLCNVANADVRGTTVEVESSAYYSADKRVSDVVKVEILCD